MGDRRALLKSAMNDVGLRYGAKPGTPNRFAPAKNATTNLISGGFYLERIRAPLVAASTLWKFYDALTAVSGQLFAGMTDDNGLDLSVKMDITFQMYLSTGLTIVCSNHGSATNPLYVTGRFSQAGPSEEILLQPGGDPVTAQGARYDPIYGKSWVRENGGNGTNVLVSAVPADFSHIVVVSAPAAKIIKIHNCAATADIAAGNQVDEFTLANATGVQRVDLQCDTGICVVTDAANSNPEMLFVYHAYDGD